MECGSLPWIHQRIIGKSYTPQYRKVLGGFSFNKETSYV